MYLCYNIIYKNVEIYTSKITEQSVGGGAMSQTDNFVRNIENVIKETNENFACGKIKQKDKQKGVIMC